LGINTVIILDTHIWIWWVTGSPSLTAAQLHHILAHASAGLGVSAISCWKVAKLVERGRLVLNQPVLDWLRQALRQSGIQFLELTPEIAVESTQLPGGFHQDPADQIIVATARLYGTSLLTADSRILSYPHVTTLP
jgi:PIN domain nuclease of toxin-antitoxin system